MSQKETVQTDIVVVGSGVTGLAAALTAAEGGARVMLFEKQPGLGGTSNFFEGVFAVESEMQRPGYAGYSRDDAFKGIMEYSHWRANARLVRAFVDESGPTIAWLQGHGVEFTEVTINMPRAPRTYHVPKGRGAAVVKALAAQAQAKGVQITRRAPVKKVLMKDGRVGGVIVDLNNIETEVAARSVIIGSGGYANNAEWIKKYTGFDLGENLIPAGNTNKMGDGIRMAWEVGAAEEGISVLELFRVGPLGPKYVMKNHAELMAVQPMLWVNQQGERFCDESIGFYETSVGNANARHREGYTYSIFDETIKDHFIEHGIDKGQGQDNPSGTRPVNFDKELVNALKEGSTDLCRASSVEELARMIGIDPATLKRTVDEYNGFCEKGHDDLFAKERKFLRPLKGPLFYAIKAKTIFLGTLGGIKVNHKMEVIGTTGAVIPGLYAGGFDAGGMYGDSYSIKDSSGASSAFALNSGRIAGKSALEYIGLTGASSSPV